MVNKAKSDILYLVYRKMSQYGEDKCISKSTSKSKANAYMFKIANSPGANSQDYYIKSDYTSNYDNYNAIDIDNM